MHRRRKHGIAEAIEEWPVSLFCFDLLYADGQDLTRLPYLERRARLEAAVTPAPRLRLATAEQVHDPEALELLFDQAIADGCEGLLCKSLSPDAGYQAGGRGWLWIKLKRDYRTELSDTLDLVVVGALAGRGRRRGMYGALLLAAYDAEADLFRTVCKCGTGFSDAELAALPERLAALARPAPPTACPPRTPPPSRRSSTCTAPPAPPRPAPDRSALDRAHGEAGDEAVQEQVAHEGDGHRDQGRRTYAVGTSQVPSGTAGGRTSTLRPRPLRQAMPSTPAHSSGGQAIP